MDPRAIETRQSSRGMNFHAEQILKPMRKHPAKGAQVLQDCSPKSLPLTLLFLVLHVLASPLPSVSLSLSRYNYIRYTGHGPRVGEL